MKVGKTAGAKAGREAGRKAGVTAAAAAALEMGRCLNILSSADLIQRGKTEKRVIAYSKPM